MIAAAQQLKHVIDTSRHRLLSIAERQASEKPYLNKWSIKEILGHLIDSAANNHQRIVRMLEAADIGKLSYTQQHWVKSQDYQGEPWENVVDFWYGYNSHLAHVIARVDPTTLNNLCDVEYAEPATLRFVIEDYLRHVQHHLDQIFSNADPRERQQWERQSPS